MNRQALKIMNREGIRASLVRKHNSEAQTHWFTFDVLYQLSERGTKELRYTHEELCKMCNTSRPTLSRGLQILQELGAIDTEGKRQFIKVLIKE